MQARKDALNCLAVETRTAEITMKREDARGAVGKRITRDVCCMLYANVC
jgi:hypothetical protein